MKAWSHLTALLLLATQAQAESIVGTWDCVDQVKGARLQAEMFFSNKGKMRGDMRIFYFDEQGKQIGEGRFDYRANYRLEGSSLYETPKKARILRYTAFGVDIRRGIEARQTRDSLLTNHKEPSKVSFDGSERMTITPPGKSRSIVCTRNSENG